MTSMVRISVTVEMQVSSPARTKTVQPISASSFETFKHVNILYISIEAKVENKFGLLKGDMVDWIQLGAGLVGERVGI